MHIISLFGDDGDTELFCMTLRDRSREDARRSGACDDDCETTASIDGDHREETDAFLSRPLDLRDRELRTILAEVDREAAVAFSEGFLASVDWSIRRPELAKHNLNLPYWVP